MSINALSGSASVKPLAPVLEDTHDDLPTPGRADFDQTVFDVLFERSVRQPCSTPSRPRPMALCQTRPSRHIFWKKDEWIWKGPDVHFATLSAYTSPALPPPQTPAFPNIPPRSQPLPTVQPCAIPFRPQIRQGRR